MAHVVLLGDSVFDNAAYVAGAPDVVRQLRAALPAGSHATLNARDGATVSGVSRQVERIPSDVTHLVVSAGGNDALGHMGVLDDKANSIASALDRLAEIRESFETAYRIMLRDVLVRGLPTAVCTIYDPRYPDPRMRRLGTTGLTVFNDVIARQAFGQGLALIDLRLVCNRDEDFANPIEPSARGGEKIARAITRLVAEHDFARRRTEVFTQ